MLDSFNYPRRQPSRYEKREFKFCCKAKKGLFSSEEVLYPSEVKKLLNQGFEVTKIRNFGSSNKKMIYANVSWQHAYGYAIPEIVSAYILGEINTFPYQMVKYSSQELYIIARKVSK